MPQKFEQDTHNGFMFAAKTWAEFNKARVLLRVSGREHGWDNTQAGQGNRC